MHALIPVKRFALAKQRLAGILSPIERCEFAKAMLADVLNVLAQHPRLDGVVLVSADPAARALADLYGVDYLPESALAAHGLNPVVQSAVELLAHRGIDQVMILHGDVPLVSASEMSQLIAAHAGAVSASGQRPALTIAPDRHREGSNCMIASPASAYTYAYGRGSFICHLRQAGALGAALRVIELPGIGFDVDWPDDVRQLALHGATRPGQAQTYLNEIDIVRRLGASTIPSAELVASI